MKNMAQLVSARLGILKSPNQLLEITSFYKKVQEEAVYFA